MSLSDKIEYAKARFNGKKAYENGGAEKDASEHPDAFTVYEAFNFTPKPFRKALEDADSKVWIDVREKDDAAIDSRMASVHQSVLLSNVGDRESYIEGAIAETVGKPNSYICVKSELHYDSRLVTGNIGWATRGDPRLNDPEIESGMRIGGYAFIERCIVCKTDDEGKIDSINPVLAETGGHYGIAYSEKKLPNWRDIEIHSVSKIDEACEKMLKVIDSCEQVKAEPRTIVSRAALELLFEANEKGEEIVGKANETGKFDLSDGKFAIRFDFSEGRARLGLSGGATPLEKTDFTDNPRLLMAAKAELRKEKAELSEIDCGKDEKLGEAVKAKMDAIDKKIGFVNEKFVEAEGKSDIEKNPDKPADNPD